MVDLGACCRQGRAPHDRWFGACGGRKRSGGRLAGDHRWGPLHRGVPAGQGSSQRENTPRRVPGICEAHTQSAGARRPGRDGLRRSAAPEGVRLGLAGGRPRSSRGPSSDNWPGPQALDIAAGQPRLGPGLVDPERPAVLTAAALLGRTTCARLTQDAALQAADTPPARCRAHANREIAVPRSGLGRLPRRRLHHRARAHPDLAECERTPQPPIQEA